MIRYSSYILCGAVFALVALGLVMLTSTGAWVKGFGPHYFLERQSIYVLIGLVAAVVAVWFPMELIRRFSPWMLLVSCVLLVLCFVPGIAEPQYGSNRWIKAPLIGQLQPSEASKMVIVFAISAWFARWQTEVHTFWRGFVIPGLIAGIPIALIAGETDVGTALSLSVAVAAIFFCVGTRMIYAVPTALCAMAGAAYFVCHDPNRWGRIEAWLDLENPEHQLDRGMQQWRALLALGNGGPWGVGLGNGVEKFGTLTFAHIDFIFPVVGEELGLPCTLAVVFCYVMITICGCGIALQANNVFNRCVALGLTSVIVVPAMVNIGVTTALLPNDGLPLPFVSFGGTSLVFSFAAVGILIGIHRRSHARNDQEFPLTQQSRIIVRL